MQKDLKIGLLFGLILIAVAVLWLSTRPSLSTSARMLDQQPVPVQAPKVSPQQNNVRTVAIETTTPKPEIPITNSTPPAAVFHIIQKGDTLSKISLKYYGTANNWQKILNANRNTIKNANKLTLGAKLNIPQ